MYRKMLFIVLMSVTLVLNSAEKREFRGIWITTVTNLDWPTISHSTAGQKATLDQIFDKIEAANFNAALLQVRDECDAFYNSAYDPWSYYLTGEQGTPKSPYWDPLEYAIEKAHKKNIELHAWLNPYRAEVSRDHHTLHSTHVYKEHPEWTYYIDDDDARFLDPGIPEVRQYIVNVVMDIVNNYDVDGIHFDDYFYPYPPEGKPKGIDDEDATTFANYSRGISNIADWRRDNVNLLVSAIYDSIQAVKPHVKFGIGPFGIWKSGTPSGIIGLSSYSAVYCDPTNWLDNKKVDYIAPQCYWPIGGSQDYNKLVPWWAQQTNGRHLYVGQAGYRINEWTTDEAPNQIQTNRNIANCHGNIFFRTKKGVLDNPKGFLDSLKNNYYKYPALPPVMSWKDNIIPNIPSNLRFEEISGKKYLKWDSPSVPSDGDTVYKYVVYSFTLDDGLNTDDAKNIYSFAQDTLLKLSSTSDTSKFFIVTALDREGNESENSDVFPARAAIVSIPEQYELKQNHPNPFNVNTTIEFSIPQTTDVQLQIFNVMGKKVFIKQYTNLIPGGYSINFDASDLVSGIYFYRIITNTFTETKKMTLIK